MTDQESIVYTPAQATTEQDALELAKRQEDTRSWIARKFIWGYLIIIGCLIVFVTFFKLPSDSSKDFLLAISSSLGFIIGYYFKSVS